MTRVLDASIAGRGLLPGQFLPEAAELLLPTEDIVLPDLFQQESLNLIFRAERRGLVPLDEAASLRSRLAALKCTYVRTQPFLDRAYEIARRFRQPDIYDAIYLVCAQDLDADLWTCDRKFVASFGAHRPANLKLCPDDA